MGEIVNFKEAVSKIHEKKTDNYEGNPKFKPTPLIQRPGSSKYTNVDKPLTDEEWALTHRDLTEEEKMYLGNSDVVDRVESKIRR